MTDISDWGTMPPRRHGWFVKRVGGRLVEARHWPPRFDVCAIGAFPAARKGRLARAVRQDLWRRMQDLRGFSPVVEIRQHGDGLCILAGGRIAAPRSCSTVEVGIAALLESPRLRDRWLTWAQQGRPA